MSNHSTAVVRLKGRIVYQTTKAILFSLSIDSSEFETDEQESKATTTGIWFPFSQVKEIHTGNINSISVGNMDDELVVTQWIAKQNGVVC